MFLRRAIKGYSKIMEGTITLCSDDSGTTFALDSFHKREAGLRAFLYRSRQVDLVLFIRRVSRIRASTRLFLYSPAFPEPEGRPGGASPSFTFCIASANIPGIYYATGAWEGRAGGALGERGGMR